MNNDLTRWNRAGLDRFRYVNGNAVTYLEMLREALAASFPQWQDIQRQLPGADTPEEQVRRLEKLLEQYHAVRGDLGWEIMRSFARACHILTEHLDVYANEGFLRTATQWDNVRRLVEMLDYKPKPPASASTLLVLQAKEGKSGNVAGGLQVKYAPPGGGKPVVFETLEDLEVDADFNALRLAGYGRSPEILEGDRLTVEGKIKDLKIGQPLILQDEGDGRLQGRLIKEIQIGEENTDIWLHQPVSGKLKFRKGYTLVCLKAADKLAPLGPAKGGEVTGKVLHLQDPLREVQVGEILFISDGDRMYFRRVKKIEGRRVSFDKPVRNLTLKNAYLTRPRLVSVVSQGGRQTLGGKELVAFNVSGDLSYLAKTWVAKVVEDTGELLHFEVFNASYLPVDTKNPTGGGYTTLKLVDPRHRLGNPQSVWVKPIGRTWEVDSYLDKGRENLLPETLLTEIPKKTGPGDLIAIVSGKQLAWGKLANLPVDEDEGTAELTVDKWRHWGGGRFYLKETLIYGHFKEKVRLVDWDKNKSGVNGGRLQLQDSQVAGKLKVGRTLLLEQEADSGYGEAHKATLRKVAGDFIDISPPLPVDKGFTVANTVLAANVVSAGHGETRPAKVLGSGDATRLNQSFVLKVKDISFVADATQPSGVRADLEISVEGRVWRQVGSLNDSGPTDAHYTVCMTEEGYVKVTFGDGIHGRRLPSGVNNIRASYRVGTGLSGNLDPGSLEKLAKPHPFVAAVRQPLASAGGSAMEEVNSMRENAPATVLTLERAVSLNDFANLAVSHSSVWQARAFLLPAGGREERVKVVLVPSGGGKLGELADTLRKFLQDRAVPGVEIKVSDYQPLFLQLFVLLRVKSAEYDPYTVKEQVRSDLLEVFSVSCRRIGQPVYLSEVYKAVEEVSGVENSYCEFKPLLVPAGSSPVPAPVLGRDNKIRILRPGEEQLIYLAADASGLVVEHEEFQL